MAVDSQQRQFGDMSFAHMPYSNTPQFTNPWTSSSSGAASSSNIYSPHQGMPNLGLDSIAKQQAARNNVAMPAYAGVPITTASAGSSLSATEYGNDGLLTMSQDLLSPTSRMQSSPATYGSDVTYSSAPAASSTHSAYVTASSAPYTSMGYAPAPIRSTYSIPQQQQIDNSRRLSQPSVPSNSFLDVTAGEDFQRQQRRQNSLIDIHDRGLAPEATRNFVDAIDASRGMIAMSQTDATPRNIYGPRGGRGSGDSYGFPSAHSTSSSISSTSTYPSYFGGSVDSSVSDYSNAGSDIESVSSRTLPRPSALLSGGTMPPAPQSMMGQFSSKISSSTQKKHKCKVCDKRFTRPSSLQTHMYSHTGEKRKLFPYTQSHIYIYINDFCLSILL